MPITDCQQKELQELGDKPIQASLGKHRTKLSQTSEKALKSLHDSLTDGTATVDQTVKIYDTTRKHLNVIDGRNDGTQQNIIILPSQLVDRTRNAIEAEISDQLSSSNNEQ